MSGAEIALRVGLAFVLAGTWIGGATMAGEKLGNRVGGLLVNLPSNIVLSLLFIGITKGVPFAVEAAAASTMGMTMNVLFIFVFVLALPRGIPAAITISLSMWFVSAVVLAFLRVESVALALLLFVIAAVGGFVALEYGAEVVSVPKKRVPFSLRGLLIRALFAGTVVASAVLIAQIAPAYITGIATTFPAVMLSTLTILAKTQGTAFTRATGKILMPSSSNIIVYAFAVRYLYPRLGLLAGTVVAFLCAVAWILLFLPLARRMK